MFFRFLSIFILLFQVLNSDENSRFGVNAHLVGDTGIEMVADAGIGWIRIDMHWARIELEKKVFSFDETDRVINYASSKGLSIIASICEVPPFYTNVFHEYKGVYLPDENVPHWEEFLAKVVTRYKSKIKYWSPWNEPNLEKFWRHPTNKSKKNMESFFKNIFTPGVETIKTHFPAAVICGPDTSSHGKNETAKEYITEMFKRHPNVGVIFHHQYDTKNWVDNFIKELGILKNHIRSIGKSDIPLWITETGADANPPLHMHYLSDVIQYVNDRIPFSSVDKIFWYALIGGPPDLHTSLLDNNHPVYSKRPLWHAYNFAITGPNIVELVSPGNNSFMPSQHVTFKWKYDKWPHSDDNLVEKNRMEYYWLEIWDSDNNLNVFNKQIHITELLWENNFVCYSIQNDVLLPNKNYKWRIRSELNSGRGTYSSFFLFSTIELPDVIISSISLEPEEPKLGQYVTIKATIKNIGQLATPDGIAVGVGFNIDGQYFGHYFVGKTLKKNESFIGTCNVQWKAELGTHTFSAKADDVDRFRESNENNNIHEIPVNIAADLLNITVTSPTTGAKWSQGSPQTITWTRSGTMNENVKIRLFDEANEIQVLQIVNSTANNGSFSWTVPHDLPAGYYRIRVRTIDNQVIGNSGVFTVENTQRRDILFPGDTLLVNHEMRSGNSIYVFKFQSDGNLVLYNSANPIWSSNTHHVQPFLLAMQHDGNLVAYSVSEAIWSSQTHGNPGAFLLLQNDGNLVIIGSSGPIWATQTSGK